MVNNVWPLDIAGHALRGSGNTRDRFAINSPVVKFKGIRDTFSIFISTLWCSQNQAA